MIYYISKTYKSQYVGIFKEATTVNPRKLKAGLQPVLAVCYISQIHQPFLKVMNVVIEELFVVVF